MNQLSLFDLMVGLTEGYHSPNARNKFKTTGADNSNLKIKGRNFNIRIISADWQYLKVSDMTLYDFLMTLRAHYNSKKIDFKNIANDTNFVGDDGMSWKIKLTEI